MFVSSLNGLLERLDVREDIYYIGHTSRFVAHELDIYSPARNRRKVAKERASIVFIDRTLDLSSCSTSQYDCLLDEIMNILPRVPGHHNDVMVDMSSLCSVHGLFMTVYKPRPSDHPLLILYIIGGITPTEVKHIQDIVNKTKPDIQVLIGSTRLCTKEDITLSSFSSDNLSFNKS
ncbi:hypothetical protein LOTGIDRAFT_176592 [Lottia gigantea]|uniref:Sec1 family domain-containing protein 2 n=1 Tax=Lottia gigantea TaxID=225164 RepID=V4ANQ2_LOTGI|nr:hypothetical protein LOTGIDRAFT_176592 [Lottia gigantea]ESO96375.1 hypothetical protein LOTGIDRAFT_176592 [Lottia gigantea]